jgi:hypothetical protein
VSHSKERKEKICLNCNAELNGRFCHLCGQENLEPRESVWSLVSHFFYDITHFDGKFFTTLGYLVSKPGFLSKEYLRGRRASYLNPIRMYVFSSALFFLIFFSMFNVKNWNINKRKITTRADIVLTRELEKDPEIKEAKRVVDSLRNLSNYSAKEDTTSNSGKLDSNVAKLATEGVNFSFSNLPYNTKAAYDSAQLALPEAERDGWLGRRVNYRLLEIAEKYPDQERQFLKDLLDRFIHTFPYLLFVSLPLYALFLKLLYIRRKRFFYVDHGIFLIHLYIFTFSVLLILFAFYKLNDVTNWSWIGYLQSGLLLFGIFYTLKAMRNFYQQGWGKTILKFILFNFLAFISLTFLFLLFLLLTVFRI